jgi:hypothetical protein
MSKFEARLKMYGDAGPPLGVAIEITDSHMHVKSGKTEVADWPIEDIRVSALEDGFHIRAEGEDVVLEVDEDAHFAVELGLRNAHPDLRKRMAQFIRDER